MRIRKKMGEVLIEAGLINSSQLENALVLQKGKNKRLGKILMELGYVTDEQVAETISKQFSIPLVDCSDYEITKDLLACVSKKTAEKKNVFPLEIKENKLTLAMANPLDWETCDEISFSTGLRISVAVSAEASIMNAIEKYYTSAEKILDLIKEIPINERVEFIRQVDSEKVGEKKISTQVVDKISDDHPIIKLVTMILVDAAKSRASDIHIEPGEKDVQVRYRIDGELRNMLKYPFNVHDSVISRIKIISNLDIMNKRLPQDGRSLLRLDGKEFDIRVSTLPSVYGEKVVMRLLDHTTGLVPLSKLGIPEHNLKSLLALISQPQGLIIVTGPTGSGKTTTLYALLRQLQSETKNIVSIEDPVEYRITGATQVGINDAIGLTFPSILRSVLRQDPDIIMVGEIRDLDTAEIATRAALTGHLVLSTLHSNDTVSTITRLIDIGVESYLVASAVSGIIAQRLVRKICDKCKVQVEPSEEIIQYGLSWLKTCYKGKGCEDCQFTGYKGRIGVYEFLIMNVELKRLISKAAAEQEIWDSARASGVITLFEDAWSKVSQGITTVEEVISKIPYGQSLIKSSEKEIRNQILLVNTGDADDRLIREILEPEGYGIVGMRGKDLSERLISLSPDLIIINATEEMFDIMRKLRSNIHNISIPVIALADHVNEPMKVEGLRWAIKDFMCRPLTPNKISFSVHSVLS
jgi:type IV pilus assembly protein PilB